MQRPSSPPPPHLPAARVADLRADLADSFTQTAVGAVLGPVATAALAREEPVPARRVTAASREPAAVLSRLFLLGGTAPRRDLDLALPRTTTAGAVALGLVAAAGEGPEDDVRAVVDLRPYEATDAAGDARWWVASDLGELATGESRRAGHVLGIRGRMMTSVRLTRGGDRGRGP